VSYRHALLTLCGVLTLFAFSEQASSADELVAPTPVQAVWKPQELEFYFQSITTFYSCRTLEQKVKRVLIAVGANRDTQVRTLGCYENQISRMPRVNINVVVPIEATPEALAELNKTKSTRDLVARVRGESEKAAEAMKQFPAEWKRVSLTRGQLNVEPGDCELIEQLKKKVLPQLAIRVVDDDVRCSPNQMSLRQPRLVVEVLTAMPRPDEALPVDPQANR